VANPQVPPSGPEKVPKVLSEKLPRGLLGELSSIFKVGLFSSDAPTRRASLLFILSLMGFLCVSSLGIKRYWSMRQTARLLEGRRLAKKKRELAQKEKEKNHIQDSTVNLGTFLLQLNDLPPAQKAPREPPLNLAEIEIVLLCDGEETRDYIGQHSVAVRSHMNTSFTSVDRDELFTQEGKKKLKKLILWKLNKWLPHGKIEDVYFSKLLVDS
jgi:flagellar basal body-associated protein FliL